MFRRESAATAGTDSDSSIQLSGMSAIPGRAQSDKRSASLAGPIPIIFDDPLDAIKQSGHAGHFPITASHRRNNRRGSMLEMTG